MICKILCLCLSLTYGQLSIDVKNHNIKSGESLSSIANNYSVPWSEIYNFNQNKIGENPNLIHPDTTILIPLNYNMLESTYKLEAWTFLLLLLLLLFCFHKKNFTSTYTISEGQYASKKYMSTSEDIIDHKPSHVDLDFKQQVFIKDAASSDIEIKEVKEEVVTQIDKLRKIKKNKWL